MRVSDVLASKGSDAVFTILPEASIRELLDVLAERNIGAVFWAIGAMLLVILAYDQLLFRPLVAWSAKFRVETTASAVAEDPWMLAMLRRTTLLRRGGEELGNLL